MDGYTPFTVKREREREREKEGGREKERDSICFLKECRVPWHLLVI
jgi:hypothetical protein